MRSRRSSTRAGAPSCDGALNKAQRGFTLVELLVSMAITVVIMGATMAALSDAVKASDAASLLTGLNGGLRTAMDLIVRDMLQVGQGLPAGRVVFIPSGAGAQAIRLPGPPGTNFTLVGQTELSAVTPGPALGPVVNGVPTDVITTIAADSGFSGGACGEQVCLTAFAADGSSVTVEAAVNITNGGADDINAGDLIMLTRGSLSTLVQVTAVNGQTMSFDAGDSLNLNQGEPVEATSWYVLNTPAPDALPGAGPQFLQTRANRIRMITYYVDNTTNPQRPRLVRRINNGHPTLFDNALGTAVAFDIEGLQVTYDLADGVNNPANVRMVASDLDGTGACNPDPCSSNQIRKVNLALSGRSRIPMRGTQQFFRNRLLTQVSIRSLAFVDRYR